MSGPRIGDTSRDLSCMPLEVGSQHGPRPHSIQSFSLRLQFEKQGPSATGWSPFLMDGLRFYRAHSSECDELRGVPAGRFSGLVLKCPRV